MVTVIRGLSTTDTDIADLLVRLKTACGAGGTLKDETIEIQGTHRDRIAELLRQFGYRIR